jgi:hypothetical protein
MLATTNLPSVVTAVKTPLDSKMSPRRDWPV